MDWEECSSINVFTGPDGNDESLPPAFTVLPSVIEKNNRTVIVHGLADFILIAEGFVHFFFFKLIFNVSIFFNVLGQESRSKSTFFPRTTRTLFDTISSMTWNGLQGFQTPIANDSFLVDGVGALGTTHTERGLTYYEVELSGHMYVI